MSLSNVFEYIYKRTACSTCWSNSSYLALIDLFWLIDKQVSRSILSRGLSGVTWPKSYEPIWTYFSSQSNQLKSNRLHNLLWVVLKLYQCVWELWWDHVSSSSHTWYGCAQVIILKRAFRRNVSFNPLKSGYRWNAQTRSFSSLLELLP